MTSISKTSAEDLLKSIEKMVNRKQGMRNLDQLNRFKLYCEDLQQSKELDSDKMQRAVNLTTVFVRNHFLQTSPKAPGVGIESARPFFTLLLERRKLCLDGVKKAFIDAYFLIKTETKSILKVKREPHKCFQLRKLLREQLEEHFLVLVEPSLATKKREIDSTAPSQEKRRKLPSSLEALASAANDKVPEGPHAPIATVSSVAQSNGSCS